MDNDFEVRLHEQRNYAEEKCFPNFTKFLTPEEKVQTEFIFGKTKGAKCIFFGGYEFAERTILGFFPSFYEKVIEKNLFPIKLLKIQGSGFKELGHRDFLGSILALGIKREFVGDIISDCDNFKAYVFLHESVFEYVISNLSKVGNDKVILGVANYSELPKIQEKFEMIQDTVVSCRLDAIVSSALNLSREKAEKFISQGLVFLNHEECLKKDFRLKNNDLLSIKGKGRFRLLENGILNKKGKLRIDIIRYL